VVGSVELKEGLRNFEGAFTIPFIRAHAITTVSIEAFTRASVKASIDGSTMASAMHQANDQ